MKQKEIIKLMHTKNFSSSYSALLNAQRVMTILAFTAGN